MAVIERDGKLALEYSPEDIDRALSVACLIADHRYERDGGEVFVGCCGDTMVRITFGPHPRPHGTVIPIRNLLVELTDGLARDVRRRGAIAIVDAWRRQRDGGKA